MTLLARVAAILNEHHIRFALIGAGAMAAHGVSRATLDQDLLVCDASVLDPSVWSAMSPAIVDIRRGDADDPLLGVIRIRLDGEPDVVDVVVGRGGWQQGVLDRARPHPVGESPLPVVDRPDLILLKLYAGGSQDRWDIESLLAADAERGTKSVVDQRVPALPARCRALWEELRASAR